MNEISNHLLFNNTRNNNGLNQSIANISNNVQKYNNYYNETVTSRNPYLFDKYGKCVHQLEKIESEDQIYIETLNGPEIRDNGKNYK